MGIFRIAQAQINSTLGALAENTAIIVKAIARARDAGADLVTFPELALCGYPPEDLLLRPQFLQDCRAALEEIIPQATGLTVVLGFPELKDARIYNAAAVINNGRRIGTYYKMELPNYGVFDEKRYFTPGTESLILVLNGQRFTVTICEDIWVAGGGPEAWAIRNRARVIVNISASPFHAGKLQERRRILSRFARQAKAYVCYNNLVGGQDELVFDGGSLVLSPEGEFLSGAKRFTEDLLVTDLELESAAEPEPGQGKAILLEGRADPSRVKTPVALAPELTRVQEIYQALVLGTRDYIRKNGFKKAVLGLSGGIDSALTAAIAVDALGEANVTGVTMPSQYSSRETLDDARLVAENLKIRCFTIPIKPLFTAYLEALEEPFKEGEPGIEHENLQARIRGNLLMALSNRFGWLVLSTGNKSENAVGYCTLYGDMVGGFAPIKDVTKTTVYELSEYVNQKAGREIIPVSTIERAPTAELKPNQKDEDSLPPYSLLDPIVHAYVEEDQAPAEIAAAGSDPEMIQHVVRMVDHNEFKRRQAAPGVKITPKAFGRDRRLPISNGYDPLQYKKSR